MLSTKWMKNKSLSAQVDGTVKPSEFCRKDSKQRLEKSSWQEQSETTTINSSRIVSWLGYHHLRHNGYFESMCLSHCHNRYLYSMCLCATSLRENMKIHEKMGMIDQTEKTVFNWPDPRGHTTYSSNLCAESSKPTICNVTPLDVLTTTFSK